MHDNPLCRHVDEGRFAEPFRPLIAMGSHDLGFLGIAHGESEVARFQLARCEDLHRCEGWRICGSGRLCPGLIRTLSELCTRHTAEHADLRAVT